MQRSGRPSTLTVPSERSGMADHCLLDRKASSMSRLVRRLSTVGDVTQRQSETIEYMEYCSLHGVNDLYRARGWKLRTVWAVFFTTALIAAAFGCIGIIRQYLERPVVVSYFVQDSDNLTLPDVVICPFNRFNRTFLDELNVTNDLRQYLEMSFPSPVIHEFQMGPFMTVYHKLAPLRVQLDELLRRLRMDFTQFIHAATPHCSAFILAPKNCSGLQTIMTSAGKCFRLPGKDQVGAGFGYGVRVIVDIPRQLYNPGVNQLLNNGVAVKFAERRRGIDNDLMFIPIGVHAIIPLRATRYEFKNDPPRYECDEHVDDSYSRVWCFDQCLTENAESICNCSLAASAHPRFPFCNTYDFFYCFAPHLFNKTDSRLRQCKRRCRTPCAYWHYEATVSYAGFPSPEARNFTRSEQEWRRLHQRIVLDVFFERLEYTLIKHFSSMTADSFIAQLGGQVSLWVGGSILSLVQFIIFVVKFACDESRQRPAVRRPRASASACSASPRPRRSRTSRLESNGLPVGNARSNSLLGKPAGNGRFDVGAKFSG